MPECCGKRMVALAEENPNVLDVSVPTGLVRESLWALGLAALSEPRCSGTSSLSRHPAGANFRFWMRPATGCLRCDVTEGAGPEFYGSAIGIHADTEACTENLTWTPNLGFVPPGLTFTRRHNEGRHCVLLGGVNTYLPGRCWQSRKAMGTFILAIDEYQALL